MILGMTSGVELVFILIVFLALLCVGMTIPFAILVPSVLYLLTHSASPG
jgi:C4-dicarboxylate transporter, DctM subunit